jgi:hypothetical protein
MKQSLRKIMKLLDVPQKFDYKLDGISSKDWYEISVSCDFLSKFSFDLDVDHFIQELRFDDVDYS